MVKRSSGTLPRNRLEMIRRSALILFAQQGYKATTMNQIGEMAGTRGPSLYKHVESKQHLLSEIITNSMKALLDSQQFVLSTATHDNGPSETMRRLMEAHARFHTRFPVEAFVMNREFRSLEPENLNVVLSQRELLESGLRNFIQSGIDAGAFSVPSARLASYSILTMARGIANWYSDEDELSEDEVVLHYSLFALRVVGAESTPPTRRPVEPGVAARLSIPLE